MALSTNINKPQAEPGIDMDALFAKIGFEPHTPAQWEYCRSTTRFNIPCCGRRWGKSQAAGHRMTYKTFIPETYNWVVGPTYKLGEKEFRVVYDDYKKLGLLPYCKKSYSVKQGDMRIETPWGSILEVVSAEKPDGLLGEGLSHAIMSEAAKHARSTWEQYVEPALSDLLGTCDFPSTPKGYNWYHGLWLLGQGAITATDATAQTPMGITAANVGDHATNYKSWRFPSWTNPIRYPGGEKNGEIIRLRALTSKHWFDQEYGASFTSLSGAIYGDEWDERLHVKQHKFNSEWFNGLAFDYGFANPFVCLDIQIGPDDTVYVWREYYERHKSTFEHGQILAARSNPSDYHVDAMWGDPRGADEAATLALVLGHVASTDVPWKHGIEQIKRMLKPGSDGFPRLYIDPSCTNLIRQMSQLRVKEPSKQSQLDVVEMTASGTQNIQHKVDDHAADALRYFVGPYFVLGAGAHLEDVYGSSYEGSESEDFFKLNTSVSLDDSLSLGWRG